jgi:hypothetical protein
MMMYGAVNVYNLTLVGSCRRESYYGDVLQFEVSRVVPHNVDD